MASVWCILFPNPKIYVKILKLVILFAGMAAIFHGDHISIMAVSGKKSGLETNAHRYLILFFHDRCHRTRRLVSVISLEKMEKPISNQFEYKGRPNN